MPRNKIDVQQINFSEAVSQDVVFSGSVKLANLGPKGNTLIIDADGQVSGSDFITIDAANNRIGVFTRTPQEAFHIHGNNATLRLGNGTNSGEHSVKLELSEQATAGGEMNYGFSVGYNGSSNDFEIRRYQNGTAGTNILTINRASNLATFRNSLDVGGTVDITGSLMVTGSTHMGNQLFTARTDTEKVGIGTRTPSHKLDINGDIRVRGNDIRDNSGNPAISFDGSANVEMPNNLIVSGSTSIEDYMILSVTADNTDIQTGTGQMTFRAPFAMELYQIPRASLSTASTSGAVTVDINNGGSTIFSTNLTIDANESTSTTAATAAVLSQTSIADDAQITVDVDGAGTGARGLKITLYYRRIV